MKKVLLLGVAIALVTAMVGLGVHAQFQDTEGALTKIKAGKLDLKVNGGDSVVVHEYNCVKPGDCTCCHPVKYTLTNIGCVNGYLDLKIKVDEYENDLVEPESEAGDITPSVGELGEHLGIMLWIDDSPNDKILYKGWLKDMPACIDIDEMLAGHDYDLIVDCWWWAPSATDSQAMTDSVELSLTFSLQQFKD